jgi:hypothetical protein
MIAAKQAFEPFAGSFNSILVQSPFALCLSAGAEGEHFMYGLMVVGSFHLNRIDESTTVFGQFDLVAMVHFLLLTASFAVYHDHQC